MSLPYFPMFPSDFEAKTSHLTLAEDGAYNRLLRLMWMSPGCTLPDDDAWIMRRMRVDVETFAEVVRPLIAEFLRREKGRVFSPRLLREWEAACDAHAKRSAAGKKGGRPPKALQTNAASESRAKAMPKQPEPEPEPELETNVSNDTADAVPSDVDPSKVMFDAGVGMLGRAGVPERKARTLLGKWRRDHGAEAVIGALGRAQREGAIDPASFIEGSLRFSRKSAATKAPDIGEQKRRSDGRLVEWSGAIDGWMEVRE